MAKIVMQSTVINFIYRQFWSTDLFFTIISTIHFVVKLGIVSYICVALYRYRKKNFEYCMLLLNSQNVENLW